jgi:hypothetical protein
MNLFIERAKKEEIACGIQKSERDESKWQFPI